MVTASDVTAPKELSSPCRSELYDELFHHIAEQTNLCNCQQIGASINTTVDKLKSFVGIKPIMGVVRMHIYG